MNDATPRIEALLDEDIDLPGGCLVCGGNLALRVRDGAARSFCLRCRFIASPRVERVGEELMMSPGVGGLC